jgi:threonine/homoserine/homoserine lactone efflux protein
MPWPELAALLVFATAMAFTPGPNTTLSAALAANHGLRRAMRFVLAVPVGWGLLLLACVAGLGALLQTQPALRGAVKIAGLAYLLWLAWRLARTPATTAAGTPGPADRGGAATAPAPQPAADPGLMVGFWQGVALQFVNIKAWMNALLISAGWITVADPVGPRLALVLPLMMAFGLASNFSYALIGATLRRWLAQGRRLLWFNRTLAALLAATAAWMAAL